MAHLIDETKGTAAFVSYLQKAWHGLGTIIEEQPKSVTELLTLGGLDYEVLKAPNVHRIPESIDADGWNPSMEIISKSSFFTYRSDTNDILGNVGAKYTPLQNARALELLDPVFNMPNVQFETAGAIMNGRRMFVSLRLPEVGIADNDSVVPYLILWNGHDGGMACKIMTSHVRPVCNNTLQAAEFAATNNISIRHTANIEDRVKLISAALAKGEKVTADLVEYAQVLRRRKFSNHEFLSFLTAVFLTKEEQKNIRTSVENISTQRTKMIQEVYHFANDGVGQREADPGSAWWAYNAVTGYFANAKEYRSPERALLSNQFGQNHRVMKRALKLAGGQFPTITLPARNLN